MIEHAKRTSLIIVLALFACLARSAATSAPAYSADGLYNLANSYAREGKPGMAVLNYERARLLAPNDPDIEANLRFVRTASHVPVEPIHGFQRAAQFLNPAALAWTGVVGVLLAGTACIAGRLSSRRRWLRRMTLVFGTALVILTASNGVILWPLLHEAVVVTNSAPARVSPVPMGDQLFTLPEAETVRMTAEHEGFVLIHTRTGQAGWVSRSNVVPVLPR
jgi:hypothetical protein